MRSTPSRLSTVSPAAAGDADRWAALPDQILSSTRVLHVRINSRYTKIPQTSQNIPDMVKNLSSQLHTRLVLTPLFMCLLFISSRLLQFTLSSLADELLVALFRLVTWLLVFIAAITTVYAAIQQRKQFTLFWLMPFLMYAVTITSTLYIPYTWTSIDIDTFIKQSEREAIIPQIFEQYSKDPQRSSGAIVLMDLPTSKYYLSSGGGQVIVREDNEQVMVMFYTWRGVLNNSSGFVIYTSHNREPRTPLMQGASRIKEHWFFGVEH
jgi:hypothetical protein